MSAYSDYMAGTISEAEYGRAMREEADEPKTCGECGRILRCRRNCPFSPKEKKEEDDE